MPKSRISFLDAAKGFAMLSIILGHLRIPSVNAVVYTYHVPVFLLITGYFFSRKLSVGTFAKKRLRLLMVPYFFTCAVLILLAVLLGLRSGTSSAQLGKWSWAAVYGSGNKYQAPFEIQSIGAIWFLPASCVAAILFRCVLELPEKWRPPVVGAVFAAGYFSTAYLFWLPMSIQAGCCFVLYLYIGWLFRENEDRIREFSPEAKIFAVLFAALVWFYFIRHFPSLGFYLVRNCFGNGVTDLFGSVCASGLVILICHAIDRKTKIISRLLRFTGRYSLLVLCVHDVEHILSEYKLLGYKELMLRHMPEEIYQYIMILYKPAVALVLVWLLLKIPAVRRLFGYDRVNA